MEEVESIIEEEITAIQSDLETDLLSEARSHARYKILSQLDGPNRVASILGWYLRRGGMGALDTFYEQYDAVSASDVSEVARQYLREETRTTAILLPPLSATSKSEGN